MHDAVPVEHADGSELDPDGDGPRKEAADLLRGRGGCQIPIEVGMAEERIPDGAPDAPGLEALVFQALGNVEDGAWRGERGHGERL